MFVQGTALASLGICSEVKVVLSTSGTRAVLTISYDIAAAASSRSRVGISCPVLPTHLMSGGSTGTKVAAGKGSDIEGSAYRRAFDQMREQTVNPGRVLPHILLRS